MNYFISEYGPVVCVLLMCGGLIAFAIMGILKEARKL